VRQSHVAVDYFLQRYAPVWDGVSDPVYFAKDAPLFLAARQLVQPPTAIGKGSAQLTFDRSTAAIGPLLYGTESQRYGRCAGAPLRQRVHVGGSPAYVCDGVRAHLF
jgi:hypothetical protein